MKTLPTVALLVATLSLSACSGGLFNQNRLDTAGGADAAGAADTGITTGALAPNSVEFFNQSIGDRVLFAVDTTNPSFTAIIEGHADEQGTREYNLALGARRAAAVRDFLVTQGVADARLRTVTFGKERPIEVCSTEVCYAKNRRAVTVIGAGAVS